MAVRDNLSGARAAGGWAAARARARTVASPSRLTLAGLLITGVISFVSSAFAANFNVADSSQLSAAISNAAPGDTITFTQNITLNGQLPQVTKDVTINGAGHQLNGQNTYQGFVVMSGTVAINNLAITQTRAQGGDGGDSYYQVDVNGVSTTVGGGGGGGAGLGGALFVGQSANVTVTNVTFQNNQAVGGIGGSTNLAGVTIPGGGGGGGRFGNGDSSAQGSGASGGSGGGGQGANSGGTPAQPGGFGGGGGGGASSAGAQAAAGAAGGFGGGGGGAARGGSPGQGGWGGSQGSEYFAPNGSNGSGNGGNGAGLGGAVFVQEGGTLTFGGTLDVASNTVTGGSHTGAASGLAAGSGLFLQGNGSFTFAPGANQMQTVSDIIADQTGVSGSGGSWSIVKNGAGTTILTGEQKYSGGITINGGVLQGTVSSLKGNIVDNAALEIVETGMANLSNAISGTGSLTKLGSGTLSLTGNMGYTGLTFVKEGTLLLPESMASTIFLDGGTITGQAGVPQLTETIVAGGGGGSIRSDTSLFVSGSISGSSWSKTGDGALVLTGVNTFAGLTVESGELIAAQEANLGQADATITLSGGDLTLSGSGANFHQNLVLDGGALKTGSNSPTWSGVISGTGNLIKTGSGVLQLTGNNTYSGGSTINEGTLWIASDSALGTGGVTLGDGTLRISGTFDTSRAFTVNGAGAISVDPSQILTLNGVVSGGTLTKLDAGTLVLNGANTFAALAVNRGRVVGNTNSIHGNITLGGLGAVTFDQLSDGTYTGDISGFGSLTKTGGGTLILTGTNTYTGGTVVEDGWLQVSSTSVRRDISVGANGTVAFDQASDGTYAGDVDGAGQFYKIGAGDLKTTGDIDVGATTVSGGTLSVNGTLTSPNIYVASAAKLGGSGTIDGNVVNSGGIAPGNSIGTITIDGALTINGGSLDMEIGTGGKSDKIIVTGPDGVVTFGVNTLNLIFEPGAVYAPSTYTLVTASQGLEGTIDTLSAEEHPANFTAYAYNTATDVLLTLTADLGNESPLSPNQAAVAHQLDAIYNSTGELPPDFADLYGLSGGALNSAMSTAMGEAATGLRPTAVQMTNTFLGLMLDPFVDGRGGTAGISESPALGYAVLPAGGAAMARHAPATAAMVQPAWATWGSVFGSAGRIDGDPFGTGSHDVSTNAAGVVGGLDYYLSPDTVLGFALGGAGGNWSMADGVGGGDTNAFEVGVYGVTHWGAAYLGGSLSFTNHWASTERAAFSQNLTGDFVAQSYGGRVEGGYRFETVDGAFTPYAAGQVQSLRQPSFTDDGVFDPGFGATFASNTADNGRAELGLRYDISKPISPDMTLALQTKFAWAHDWFSGSDLSATFVSLPIGYVVAGATPAHDLALVSAGAELRLDKGLSVTAKFDTELSDRSTLYTGIGTVRWEF